MDTGLVAWPPLLITLKQYITECWFSDHVTTNTLKNNFILFCCYRVRVCLCVGSGFHKIGSPRSRWEHR